MATSSVRAISARKVQIATYWATARTRLSGLQEYRRAPERRFHPAGSRIARPPCGHNSQVLILPGVADSGPRCYTR